ncbi:MAG: hypothetical protein JWP22_3304 [Ramlibacter sp.]|jgi:hypothetical protein|nr:hypothetical protein [Ramlibacter sp.]MDB5914629.1 hypothetical protein [Ramlibacter sp.]
MGLTKRFMEFEEERDAARSALQELLDIGRIGYPATVKIAERVVADGNLDSLSAVQKEVFHRFIAPKLRIACEVCMAQIPLASYPEVIASPEFEGQILCDGCLLPR